MQPLPDENLDALVVVLDEIRLERSGSRAEIARKTGLTRAVVSQRVADLIDRGLVTESGTSPSTGGRPPRRLDFGARRGHLLVADLGATSIDVAATDLNGAVLAHLAEPTSIAAGPDVILGRVDELFERLRSEQALPGDLWGIGLGVPGPVEFRSGRPISPPIMPGWHGLPIRERFAARYGCPVWIDNDVNVLAVGEWRIGVARGHDNVVVIKVGTGVGAGIISDGRLHRGAQGSAGDVGHTQVTDGGATVCRCGKSGCLEAVAGGSALARDGEAAARQGRSAFLARVLSAKGSIEAEDVTRAAEHGDGFAAELLQAAGRHVGMMLATVVNFFNPSLILIGGGVAGAGDKFLAAIREVVYARSLPLATRDLVVRRTSLGERGGVIGAGVMVADELFARDYIRGWIEQGAPVEGTAAGDDIESTLGLRRGHEAAVPVATGVA
jgi:glucokinase-like ROK family protein